MPISPPPSYATRPAPAPQAPPRQLPEDSLLVAQRRRQQGNRVGQFAVVPEAEPVQARPVLPLPNRAEAIAPRVPKYEPTRVLHENIPALGERQKESNLVRMVRRVTLTETKYTPEQKADLIIDWLVRNDFMVRTDPKGRASQKPSKFYNHDTVTSRLFDGYGVSMTTNMPWLEKSQLAVVRAILIDRVHASKADPQAPTASTRDCLIRYFQTIKNKQPLQPITEVVTAQGAKLTRLSALHNSDVYFDPKLPVAAGGLGVFYVGITRKGYPVGIKAIDKDGAAEAKTMRSLAVGGYLQAHFAQTSGRAKPVPTWVVMPCYGGTLEDVAKHFLALPSTPRHLASGGLIGARYMLLNLCTELAHLHLEMRGIHADIKARNIFVSILQRRFVLGDFGISRKMSAQGDMPYTGSTLGLNSPEQENQNERITAATDIFSLAVTAMNGLLELDPAVRRMWRQLHPHASRPTMLFPNSETETGLAFVAWFRFNEPHGAQAAVVDDSTQAAQALPGMRYEGDYQRLDAVMQALDAPLWQALRWGLRKRPQDRPTALQLREKIWLNAADTQRCETVWPTLAPYNKPIDKEIKRLKSLLTV